MPEADLNGYLTRYMDKQEHKVKVCGLDLRQERQVLRVAGTTIEGRTNYYVNNVSVDYWNVVKGQVIIVDRSIKAKCKKKK